MKGDELRTVGDAFKRAGKDAKAGDPTSIEVVGDAYILVGEICGRIDALVSTVLEIELGAKIADVARAIDQLTAAFRSGLQTIATDLECLDSTVTELAEHLPRVTEDDS